LTSVRAVSQRACHGIGSKTFVGTTRSAPRRRARTARSVTAVCRTSSSAITTASCTAARTPVVTLGTLPFSIRSDGSGGR
jgi:hypothetical protein